MSEQFTNIILSEFNRKLAYAVDLGVQYAIYNNSYEQYKFLYGEYVCVSFTLVSYDVKDRDWDTRYDCESPVNYAEELGKPDNQKIDVYKPITKEAQYLAVIEVVLTGDDKNDSRAKVDELSEALNGASITNETAISGDSDDGDDNGGETASGCKMMVNTNAEEDEDEADNDGQRRRRRFLSIMQESFTQIVEYCMMTSDALSDELSTYPLADTSLDCSGYIGLDLDEFVVVSLDAQQFTIKPEPPPKSLIARIIVDILRYAIYVFIACCLLTAIIGKWHAKSIQADNVKPWSIFWFALYTWDFYSDLLFSVRLLEYCINKERQYHVVWWIFAASSLFVVIPWVLNLRQLIKAQKKWTTDSTIQEGVRGWFIDWSIVLVVAVALTGSSFGAIELANSNLFGHELFCMGLAKKHLKAFQGKRFYSSVLFENAPQLAAQIYFLVLLGEFDEATVTALLSSGVSIVLSVVDIWSAKHLVKVMKKQSRLGQDVISLQFRIDTNLNDEVFDEIEQNKRLFLGQPKALSKAIAETLVVHRRNIEIYQLIAANPGIKVGLTVYVVDDRNLDSMLNALRSELKRLQLLISIHWKMKTYPRVSNIRAGQSEQRPKIVPLTGGDGDGDGDGEATVETQRNGLDGEVYSVKGRYRNTSVSSMTYSKQAQRTLIRIQDMNELSRSYIKQNDPEYRALGISSANLNNGDDKPLRKGTMSVLSYTAMNDDDMKQIEPDGVGSAAPASSTSLWGSFAALLGNNMGGNGAMAWNMSPDDGSPLWGSFAALLGNNMGSNAAMSWNMSPVHVDNDAHSDGGDDGDDDGDGNGDSDETGVVQQVEEEKEENEQDEEEQKQDVDNKWSRYMENVMKLISWHSEQPMDNRDIHAQWLLSLENMNMLLGTREKLQAQNKVLIAAPATEEILEEIEEESDIRSDSDEEDAYVQ
eukprot:CAMPEP_0202732606 /NCGR_PEP_ID=MMETSP1385-20130828/187748_1 /ASSEMBLY_ACC=CAM_ASM_000861 /TAXON_ID=933848 /ORGANISM="Elphidium margaritaceum" /LENGTH=929 /DNA_ID=CAMNT_0049398929 /DNA_START=243 /DNA_END=3032 /DNA_ORIENTATION=+